MKQHVNESLPRAELDVRFSVLDAGIRLLGFPVARTPFLDEHYPGFFELGEDSADLLLEVEVAESGLLIPLPPSGAPPVVEVEEEESGRLRTRSHWHEAEFDLERGSGRVRFSSLRSSDFRMSLENLLRVAFANLLLRREACLLHAAALVGPVGAVDVFFAPSGGGKSRLVAAHPDRPALSDDLIALELNETGVLLASRVPFHGEFPSTSRAEGRLPVRHLLRLVPEGEPGRRPWSAVLAAASLRACMPFLSPGGGRGLELATRIVRAHPVEQLAWREGAELGELLA